MDYNIIGVMGCLTSNSNMGCSALTYTLLQLLEKQAKDNIEKRKYIIFDIEYNEERVSKMCAELEIERERILVTKIGETDTHTLKKTVKCAMNMVTNINMISLIKKCCIVIDLTQGDSFTDIYGLDRFYHLSSIKKIVQELGVPLILGPQTYGPFENEKCRIYAKKIIEKADLVISRDDKSKKYIESFCDADVKVATDIAFGLEFTNLKKSHEKIKVGINISGLLHSHKTDGSALNSKLKTNYDEYVKRILEYFLENEKFEVHLIPHVGSDANEAFMNVRGIQIHEPFESPIDAKNIISTMDIFIGARMHATIGAFSAGVATIPIGYSRKFSGLYENIGYPYVIDLLKLNTEEAYNMTIRYVNKYEELESKVKECSMLVKKKYEVIEQQITKKINELGI